MAENQADDDDDEGFGDFKFVSYSNNSNQINKDDDDWGDFVDNFSPKQDLIQTPIQFPLSNGFSHPPNPINPSQTQKNLEFFSGFSDQWTNPSESQPNVDSEKNSASPAAEKRWEKPKGALPLSLFGDEEEEDSDTTNPPFGNNQNLFSSQQAASTVRNGVSFGSGIGIKDILVNLYTQSEQIKTENGLNLNSNDSNLVDGNGVLDDDDDDGWEFKDAFVEKKPADSFSELKIDENVSDLPGIQVEPQNTINGDIQVGSKISENSKGVNGQLGDNWFVTSDEFSYKPTGIENGLVFESGGTTTASGCNSDPLSQSKQIGTENGLNSYFVDGNFDFDENFCEFKDSFAETGATNCSAGQKEELKVGDHSGVQVKVPTLTDEVQVNGKELWNNLGALPVSEFSNGRLDSDDPLFGEDIFSYKHSTSMRNGVNNQVVSSNFALNDLISNLYSQAEQIPTALSSQEATENGFNSAQTVLNSDLVTGEDDFDENSWEFKAASSEPFFESGPGETIQKIPTEAKSTVLSSQEATENGFNSAQTALNSDLVKGKHDFDENSWEFKGSLSVAFLETGPGDTLQMFPTESKLKTFIDFYCRLKEESYFVALHHLDGLKKAKTAAALSNEDAKAEALHEEIQAAYKKLHREGVISEERPPRNDCLNELLELMKEPKLQVLDSEFNLSKRISLAEKNMSSAIEIFQHAISMVKILTLGSMEDQVTYITTWSKILSACAQELKHGAFIWKQSLQKKVHRQMLSRTQGQQYVLALGEIYRVVGVLRTSSTLYKPWILSSLANPKDIFALLEECTAAWSDSRLEEALLSFSDQVGFGYEGTIKALLESIKSVHDLDGVALQNYVFALQEPICRLSLLSLKIVPDMKAVMWNGKHYFLALANLWANLISSDPPKLSHIHVG
ncbi:hypothetical protein BVC80_9037g2 [Macleaya cordata]|uniref:Synergin gamma C-terminal domain-containing protein n=1 Tax=Macleaya cordata TaxID=56857 RepID=A0A200Q5N4_MACCD|nr:hypothetical protein BVC80_9037g2 [Macleaya cordata]